MQKVIDVSFFDWSRDSKPTVLARGISALIPNQIKSNSALSKESFRYVWPSGYDNISSRYLSRKIKGQ